VIIGLGVDVVDIARARRMLDSYGDRALSRTCTDAESAYIRSRANPAQHLAVRLAAKEAAFKALSGTDSARQVGWREIEVVAADGGPPGLELRGRARARADELGVERSWVSLSHGDGVAVAVVVFEVTSSLAR
jgi:holo-[acyl-carrier protein] synthase